MTWLESISWRRLQPAMPPIEILDWTRSKRGPYTEKGRPQRGKTVASSESRSQVELLHQISNIVSSNLGLERMLQELIGMAVNVTGCDACLVYLVDHASHEIVLRAS